MKKDIQKHKNHSYNDVILCDFDGTITKKDVTDEILNNYGHFSWKKIGKSYLEGKISHGEMNQKFIKMVKATPEQLSNLSDEKIKLRKGLSQLVNFAETNKFLLVVVSSGWDFYIKQLLEKYNPVFIKQIKELVMIPKGYLPVIANSINYDYKNYCWNLNLKWDCLKCKISSPCKAKITRSIKKLGIDKVIAIGNSESDTCFVEEADMVFSAGSLTSICSRNGISTKHFVDFQEIVNQLSLTF